MDISDRLGVSSIDEEIEPFLAETVELIQKRRSQGRIIFDRFMRNRVAVGGAIFLLFLFLYCFVGPAFWRVNPDQPHFTKVSDTLAPPSWEHPFGTDSVGRDQFARAMVGGQVSLIVGMFSMLLGIAIGTLVGALAGFYGGWLDNALMRITDIVLAVPLYLLLFVLSVAFSDGTPRTVILIIAVFSWTYAARLIRSEFLALKEREFVMAARTIGAGNFRLMFRHILPNAVGPIIVNATLLIGANIITESILSYFGFGVQP
ncbi:MAG TPA: ABC transporter permease, partial [Ktedonobacteraceae bacterium]|nr:ABC transporter permease [Ktedonobacteraceae bacterium]